MNFSISDKTSIEFSGSVYVNRHKEPRISSSVIRTVSIPSALSAFFGRILHQSWLVNKYKTDDRSLGSLELCAARGRRLIKVDLEKDDKVSFKIKNLVFWTNKVSLNTRINFSVAHFASKMNFIQTATGPGTIILEISGEPVMISHESEMLPPDRLVAWSAHADFSISGAHTWLDVYYNGPLVRISPNSYGVMDSDDGDSRSWAGVWDLIRRFYMP